MSFQYCFVFNMLKYTLAICFLVAAPLYVQGHGMVLDPVNRASRWRVDSSAPPNYGDNQLWCGGAGVNKLLMIFLFIFVQKLIKLL